MLIKAFSYDQTLYNQCFASQKKTDEYKKITLELTRDKQTDEQTIQNQKEEIAHLQNKLTQQTKNFRRRKRENITTSSTTVVSMITSHRSRNINFFESLKDIDSKKYNS